MKYSRLQTERSALIDVTENRQLSINTSINDVVWIFHMTIKKQVLYI